MANTGLYGPFDLTDEVIDKVVKGVGAGAYALGTSEDNEVLKNIYRIGRSDTDLNRRLKEYVGTYKHFKYAFYPNAHDAYRKECELYHNFTPRDNAIHPDKPNGTSHKCNHCNS